MINIAEKVKSVKIPEQYDMKASDYLQLSDIAESGNPDAKVDAIRAAFKYGYAQGSPDEVSQTRIPGEDLCRLELISGTLNLISEKLQDCLSHNPSSMIFDEVLNPLLLVMDSLDETIARGKATE